MAIVFELNWGATTVDMTMDSQDNDGIGVSREYQPAVGDIEGGYVTDEMRLRVKSPTDDGLATYVQSLDRMRDYAARYEKDPTFVIPVWLNAKMDEETGERRAQVRSIRMDWESNPLAERGLAVAHEAHYILRVEHGPWERPQSRGSQAASEASPASTKHDYTLLGPRDPTGIIPARIEFTTWTSDATGAPFARLWAGLRSAIKHGVLANFEEIWELEDGANNGAESGITDDNATDLNDSSPGSGSGIFVKLIETDLDWDFDTNGGIFQQVLEITIADVSAEEIEQFGYFLWLLRAMNSGADTTWQVQLRWGAAEMDDEDFRFGPIKEITAAAWDFFEMGSASVPLRDLHGLEQDFLGSEFIESSYAIQIWARRTAGATNLYLDCLCPIPLDEGYIKITDFDIPAGTLGTLVYAEGPDGTIEVATFNVAGEMTARPVWSGEDFRLPVGDGRLIWCYAGPTTTSILTGISAAGPLYIERWPNLRGGD